MEESKIIFQEDKLLSGQAKLEGDEYLLKECFITNLRIETKEYYEKRYFINFLGQEIQSISSSFCYYTFIITGKIGRQKTPIWIQ